MIPGNHIIRSSTEFVLTQEDHESLRKWEALLLRLRDHTYDEYVSQKAKTSVASDVRYTMFAKMSNVLWLFWVLTRTISTRMAFKEFWTQEWQCNPADRIGKVYEYVDFLKRSILLETQLVVESSLRVIDVALKLGKPSDTFGQVYTRVLNQLGLQSHIPTLDLLTKTRNTVHNNGRFDKASVVVTFKGQDYRFTKGENLDFVCIDLLLEVVEECIALFKAVVGTPEIQSLDSRLVLDCDSKGN